MTTINVATDFYKRSAGRFKKDHAYSGEAFREDVLKPKLNSLPKNDKLLVDFSEVSISATLFLDEAFAGLVRSGEFTSQELEKKSQSLQKTTQPFRLLHGDMSKMPSIPLGISLFSLISLYFVFRRLRFTTQSRAVKVSVMKLLKLMIFVWSFWRIIHILPKTPVKCLIKRM